VEKLRLVKPDIIRNQEKNAKMLAANNHGKFDAGMLETTAPRVRNHAFW
jgi:hypothetical protein